MTGPRIGSLFSGYGGLDLAATAVLGGTVAWHVEHDPAPSRILDHHWPGVPNYGDVTTVDWTAVEPVDVLTGGFPCQDLSLAGRRLGLRPGTRSGLWEHMAYAIDQLRPSLVVIENVRGLLSAEAHGVLEPCPWCVGDDGGVPLRALGAVLGDLADLGYDAAWHGLRAADVGAPHSRFRVFVVAWPAGDAARVDGQRPGTVGSNGGPVAARGAGRLAAENAEREPSDERRVAAPGQAESGWARADAGRRDRAPAADPAGDGRGRGAETARGGRADRGGPRAEPAGSRADADRWGPYATAVGRWAAVLGRPAPPPTVTSDRGGERLSPAFVEWMMGLPPGWVTAVPGLTRNDQLKALGNGVVPQQAAAALEVLLPHAHTRREAAA